MPGEPAQIERSGLRFGPLHQHSARSESGRFDPGVRWQLHDVDESLTVGRVTVGGTVISQPDARKLAHVAVLPFDQERAWRRGDLFRQVCLIHGTAALAARALEFHRYRYPAPAAAAAQTTASVMNTPFQPYATEILATVSPASAPPR